MRLAIPLLLSFGVLFAGTGVLPNGKLDMPTLQDAYKEGKLDEVKENLEVYLKEKGDGAGKGELIFINKYLGLIYAANPNDRSRADSYFSQLLTLAPTFELTDTHVSKDIQDIFDQAKKDFQRAQEYNAHHDAFGNPIEAPKEEAAPGSKPSHAWVWWTAGLTTVAAGASVAAWMMQPDKPPAPAHFAGAF